jgi:hypothetical protein
MSTKVLEISPQHKRRTNLMPANYDHKNERTTNIIHWKEETLWRFKTADPKESTTDLSWPPPASQSSSPSTPDYHPTNFDKNLQKSASAAFVEGTSRAIHSV